MLSKLIVHAPDRATAIARMRRALDEYFVGGIKTNLPLFRRILEHPDFVAARIDTGFLDRLLAGKLVASGGANGLAEIAAVSAALFAATALQKNGHQDNTASAVEQRSNESAWKRTARSEGVRGE
jgi:acetyl-CoA carboxylase biotin carboxylase subunit